MLFYIYSVQLPVYYIYVEISARFRDHVCRRRRLTILATSLISVVYLTRNRSQTTWHLTFNYQRHLMITSGAKFG